MDEPTEEGPVREVAASDPEGKIYTHREWDLDRWKWKTRMFALACLAPLSFLAGLDWRQNVVGYPPDVGTVVLVNFLILALLITMMLFHSYKYYKAAGK